MLTHYGEHNQRHFPGKIVRQLRYLGAIFHANANRISDRENRLLAAKNGYASMSKLWGISSYRMKSIKMCVFRSMVVQTALTGQQAEGWGLSDVRDIDMYIVKKLRTLTGGVIYVFPTTHEKA